MNQPGSMVPMSIILSAYFSTASFISAQPCGGWAKENSTGFIRSYCSSKYAPCPQLWIITAQPWERTRSAMRVM